MTASNIELAGNDTRTAPGMEPSKVSSSSASLTQRGHCPAKAAICLSSTLADPRSTQKPADASSAIADQVAGPQRGRACPPSFTRGLFTRRDRVGRR